MKEKKKEKGDRCNKSSIWIVISILFEKEEGGECHNIIEFSIGIY